MLWRLNIMLLFCLCAVSQSFALRDPTQPPAEQLAKMASKEDKQFVVSSIFHATNYDHVVINGKVLKVGDTINGATIMKIEENQVELMQGPMVIRIPVYQKIKDPVK